MGADVFQLQKCAKWLCLCWTKLGQGLATARNFRRFARARLMALRRRSSHDTPATDPIPFALPRVQSYTRPREGLFVDAAFPKDGAAVIIFSNGRVAKAVQPRKYRRAQRIARNTFSSGDTCLLLCWLFGFGGLLRRSRFSGRRIS